MTYHQAFTEKLKTLDKSVHYRFGRYLRPNASPDKRTIECLFSKSSNRISADVEVIKDIEPTAE